MTVLTYILAFLIMVLVAAGMAVGVIVAGKKIRGSCGGLNCLSCSDSRDCPRKKNAQADT